MPNYIEVKDANATTIKLHTIEDSTSTHFNQSIPITVSGAPLFVDTPGNVSITNTLPIPVSITGGSLTATIADNAPVSVRGGVLNAVSIGGGTANIGTVSISPTQAAVPVSIVNDATVSIRAGFLDQVGIVGAASIGGGTAQIGRVSVFVDQVPFNVSINNALPVHVSLAGGPTFSTPGADDLSPGLRTLYVTNFNYVYDTAGNNWDRWDGKVSIGNSVPVPVSVVGGRVSIQGSVSISPQTINVHVCNSLPAAGATQLVSVGGVVSTQGVQIVGRDINGDARTPRMHTDGSLIVHISAGAAGGSGGDVSVSPTQGSIPVSIAGGSLSIADNAPVSVRGGVLNAVSIGGGTAQVGRVSVFVDQVPFNVSINNSLPIPVSVINTATVSINAVNNGIPNADGQSLGGAGQGHLNVRSVGMLFNRNSNTWDRMTGTSVGLAILPVSIAPQTINVNVCNSLPAAGATITTSIGGAVSLQAIQIAGVDGAGNARTPLTDTTGALVITSIKDDVSIAPQVLTVHVCNALPAAGATVTVSIGGAVSTQAVPVAYTDGTNARIPLVTTGGIQLVHVCNAAPGGAAGGGSPQVSIAGAVSNQATQIAGVDDSGNARTPLMDVSGTQKMGGFTINPEYVFTRPTDTVSYAVGDLVANTTVAGTCVPLSFPVSRLTGGGGSFMIRRARLITPNDNRTTDRSYRLHIFNIGNGLVSVANGDNGVFSPSQVSVYAGYIDIPMHLSATTGAAGIGVPGGGSEINIQLAASQVSITGLLEARTSIAPTNAGIYRVMLEILQD